MRGRTLSRTDASKSCERERSAMWAAGAADSTGAATERSGFTGVLSDAHCKKRMKGVQILCCRMIPKTAQRAQSRLRSVICITFIGVCKVLRSFASRSISWSKLGMQRLFIYDMRGRHVSSRLTRLRYSGWIQMALPPPETILTSSTVVFSTGCVVKVVCVALVPASGASA